MSLYLFYHEDYTTGRDENLDLIYSHNLYTDRTTEIIFFQKSHEDVSDLYSYCTLLGHKECI